MIRSTRRPPSLVRSSSRFRYLALAGVVLVTFAIRGRGAVDAPLSGALNEEERSCYASFEHRLEAGPWVDSNPYPAPLAANRFDRRGAIAFLDSLYQAGADSVLAVDLLEDPWEEGTYTATLLVRLPADPDRRSALFAISNRHAEAEGFAREADEGQPCVLLWWD